MARTEKDKTMLETPISRLIPKMAVPTIVAQLISTVYNLVDAYFVSTLGTAATAAIGVNSSLERTITMLGGFLGAGACSYIARLLGAQKRADADRVLSTVFFIGMLLGTLLAAAGFALMEPMVRALGATEDCISYSMDYARYVLLAAPFMVGSLILNMCLRGEGSAMYAMIGIGFGGILNCFLDPLFIFRFGYGVAGASMATAISKIISFFILLFPYLRRRSSVLLSLHRFRVVGKDIKEVASIGSTSLFRAGFSVVAGILTNNIAGAFSTSALAAISVANRVMEFPFAIILGFGQGYHPVVGYNWGAKRYDRVKQSFRFASKVSLIGAAIIGALLFVAAEPVIRLFNREADGEVLRLGMLCIRLQCLTLPAHGWPSIINMFYSAVGKPVPAVLMSTSRQGYCLIPMLLILPPLFGANGVAMCQACADILTLAVAIPLAIGTHTVIRRKEAENTSS